MNLDEWIRSLFPVSMDTDWEAIFSKASSPFSADKSEKLAEFIEECVSISGIFSYLDELLPILLSSGTPLAALSQFLDFSKSYQKKFKNSFNWSHPNTKALLYVFGRSNFLATRLKRNPELAMELLDSPFLYKKKKLAEMEKVLRQRVDQKQNYTLSDFKTALRCFKYEEFLRITVRDLAELCPFEETLEELSSVAICCLRESLSFVTSYELVNSEKSKNELAEDATGGQKRESLSSMHLNQNQNLPFGILALGKLGGNELNFSSDVDLIFIHDNETITGNLEYDHKLRIKAARLLIEVMSEVTEEGFLARMDMRLRPGGERSPLVLSLDETEFYYTASREMWERQALIKASPVAGSGQLSKDVMNMVKPFVYRSLLDEEVLHDVQKVKERIEEEHLREDHLNIKLGVGGIREIEFFVQTFQLLYGGVNKQLQLTGTLQVLQQLIKTRLIPKRDAELLQEAYLFLRRVEHHLQLRDEHQSHTIPSSIEQQYALARSLGYKNLDAEKARQKLLSELKDVMGRVRAIFNGLFSRKHLEIEASIRKCARIKHFTNEEKHYIESFSQQLVPLISQDTKIHFQRLFESINVQIDFYRKLSQYPSALSRLTRIAETSDMLWNYLLNNLELLEQLDNPIPDISVGNLTKTLEDQLSTCKGNEEEEIDRLRKFKHTITFLLGSAEMEGLVSYEQARIGITLLAEIIVKSAFDLSQKSLASRYGDVKNSAGEICNFAIVGLGKLGGEEMTYHSDLDLIFIHSGEGATTGPSVIGSQEYWIKIIQRLISCLSTITRTGFAYKLDTRLRPSGNAGVLVSALDTYINYHESSEIWEHQALIKARVIGGRGNSEWFQQVKDVLHRAVYEWHPPKDFKASINHLRQRKENELSLETKHKRNIKEGRGGLLDVEYLTQALQLKHGRLCPQVQNPKTMEALRELGRNSIIKKQESKVLQKNYLFLRLIENGLRLIYDDSTNLLDFKRVQQNTILQLLKHQGYSVNNLSEAVELTTKEIRDIYLNYF